MENLMLYEMAGSPLRGGSGDDIYIYPALPLLIRGRSFYKTQT